MSATRTARLERSLLLFPLPLLLVVFYLLPFFG
ncbi:ABC transporter permease, partial [Pseudomonas protegens]|nr:ABC transporter permease [Pseudomonas protegens]